LEYEEYKIMYEAEDTHWWYRGMRGVMLRLLNLKSNPTRQPSILDAGCGTGGNLHALELAGYRNLSGFDLSPIALSFCRERGLTDVRQGSITDIPFDADTFDIIVSCDVVTDAGTDNEMTALAELNRVLKPGGRLFLNLPAFGFLRSEHDRATDVARRVTAGEIKLKLQQAGFRIKRATYWDMFLFPIVVAVRLFRRERPEDLGNPARSDIVLPRAPFNFALTTVVRLEGLMLNYINLPIGSSVAVVAVKPHPGAAGSRAAQSGPGGGAA
jgi:SAM-dependent methyltransferase